jgi:hypothetical protein
MGCIARLGCLLLLAVLTVGGWFTRDLWMPERFRTHAVASSRVTGSAAGWEPVSNAGAERARVALEKLSEPRGQAFQTLSSGDLASYAIHALSPGIVGSADSVQTRVVGDAVTIRANVRTADLGSVISLGPVAGMIGGREPVELTGTFHVVHPGLADFDVTEAKVRNLPIPRGMIATLIRKVGGTRPAGLSETALALPIPRSIGDIRVSNGKVTLYKSVQ